MLDKRKKQERSGLPNLGISWLPQFVSFPANTLLASMSPAKISRTANKKAKNPSRGRLAPSMETRSLKWNSSLYSKLPLVLCNTKACLTLLLLKSNSVVTFGCDDHRNCMVSSRVKHPIISVPSSRLMRLCLGLCTMSLLWTFNLRGLERNCKRPDLDNSAALWAAS